MADRPSTCESQSSTGSTEEKASVSKSERTMSHSENTGPPLDYSFKNLLTLEGIENEKPRKGVKNYRKSKAGRYLSTALRLNNNQLVKIDGISNAVNQILEYPERLTWLDLSFNKLADIPQDLTALPNLKIIYLHGNHLADLPSILKTLKMLLELYSLTLHGNPVEERKGYRSKVLAYLPHLKSLDFNNVTSADRKKIAMIKKK
ncbi:hypothetical protein O3M35_012702 [Rhynocoris fuscipes]|uniref:Leucine-rich repeat-containing protein 51 n=1 Tax=Rhynocoris fuscipes TaxID=488301 RepID=A0AAW1CUG4_9HEMI